MTMNINIVGYVGRDPELRFTDAGVAVCNFSVASTKRFTNKDGEKQETTTWVKVTAWRKLAEIVAEFVKKGSLVYVIADEIQARGYLGKQDGEPKASLEVTAINIQFFGSQGGGRRDEQEPQRDQFGDYGQPPSDLSDIPF